MHQTDAIIGQVKSNNNTKSTYGISKTKKKPSDRIYENEEVDEVVG